MLKEKMEKRAEKRLNHCLGITFGNKETLFSGWTRNISLHGMMISSENQGFPIEKEIKILVKIGGDSIAINGLVCWNNEFQKAWVLPEKQMGLFIKEPSSIYSAYINRLS